MLIDMGIKIAEGCKMTAASTAEHHDGVLGETAAIISD